MSEEMVIKHCSPTLAGLKTGSMFTCECGAGDMLEREIEALNSKLSDKGIRAMILRKRDGRALIYVFRPEALTKDFKDELTCSLLRERGYCCMAKLLLGKEVNEKLNERIIAECEALKAKGVNPTLAIVRCGERPDDLSYERGATKRAETLGVAVEKFVLPEDVSKEELLKVIDDINANDKIHGVLMFRPLPKHLKADQDEICNRLDPRKDVDGMTDGSNAGVFMGKELGFAPCTPAACMEILDHYGIDCTGKKAVVIGRSLVVGKPAAMMLMGKNATVTVCHTRTKDVPAVAREADILISAAGVLRSLTKEYVRPGQIVVDVSINWDPEKVNAKGGKGAIAGDAVFEEVEPIVEAITPVPGGVGAVTTSVLIGHVVEAAKRANP